MVFDKFKIETKKVFIDALDAEVELRQLTLGEVSAINATAIKSVNEAGKPEMDPAKILDAKFMKVSAMLINPKMTVQQLKGLSAAAQPAIDEILRKSVPAGN